jgi:hypothetical protein
MEREYERLRLKIKRNRGGGTFYSTFSSNEGPLLSKKSLRPGKRIRMEKRPHDPEHQQPAPNRSPPRAARRSLYSLLLRASAGHELSSSSVPFSRRSTNNKGLG